MLFRSKTGINYQSLAEQEIKGKARDCKVEIDSKEIITRNLKALEILTKIYPIFSHNQAALESVLKKLRKKSTRLKWAMFIRKNKCYLAPALMILVGGSSFLAVWEEFYLPSLDKLNNLQNQRSLIHFLYNATHCPGDSYWRRPNITIDCYDSEFGWYHPIGRLITQEDYCLVGGDCRSDFVNFLINHLPTLCIPIMAKLCEVLQEISDVEDWQFFAHFLLIAGPIIFTLIALTSAYGGFRYFSLVTEVEESEAKRLLGQLGILDEGQPFQLIESVSSLDDMENRYRASRIYIQELMNYFPCSVLIIYEDVLKFLGIIPPKQTLIDKARIRWDIYEKEAQTLDQKTENPTERRNIQSAPLNLPNLFRKIGEIREENKLKNGKYVEHERKDLDPESVAERVFQFAGLNVESSRAPDFRRLLSRF